MAAPCMGPGAAARHILPCRRGSAISAKRFPKVASKPKLTPSFVSFVSWPSLFMKCLATRRCRLLRDTTQIASRLAGAEKLP